MIGRLRKWWKRQMFRISYRQIRHGCLLDRWEFNRMCENATLLPGGFVILPSFKVGGDQMLVIAKKLPRTGNWRIVKQTWTIQAAAQWAWDHGRQPC